MTDFLRTNYRLTGGRPNTSELTSYFYAGSIIDSFADAPGSYFTDVFALFGFTTTVAWFRAQYCYGGTSATGGQPTASAPWQVYGSIAASATGTYFAYFKAGLWHAGTSAGATDAQLRNYLTISIAAGSTLQVEWDALVISTSYV